MPGTQVFDPNFQLMLDQHAANAEVLLEAAVLFYSGEIHYKYNPEFKLAVEELKKHGPCTDRIAVFLTTGGGIPEAAEMMVTILRKHYEEVFFVVPHHAMSAGTMICMSGNKILMEYSSMLGPIDPQVPTPDQQGYVPALGYIDKVEDLLNKQRVTQGEGIMLSSMDLARLALFDQAKDLAIELVTQWLSKYKFASWTTHRTNSPGTAVTENQRETRAQQIAAILADHKRWKTHGRPLDLQKLLELRIEIDDYSDIEDQRNCFRAYGATVNAYMSMVGAHNFIHIRSDRNNRRQNDKQNC